MVTDYHSYWLISGWIQDGEKSNVVWYVRSLCADQYWDAVQNSINMQLNIICIPQAKACQHQHCVPRFQVEGEMQSLPSERSVPERNCRWVHVKWSISNVTPNTVEGSGAPIIQREHRQEDWWVETAETYGHQQKSQGYSFRITIVVGYQLPVVPRNYNLSPVVASFHCRCLPVVVVVVVDGFYKLQLVTSCCYTELSRWEMKFNSSVKTSNCAPLLAAPLGSQSVDGGMGTNALKYPVVDSQWLMLHWPSNPTYTS